MIPLSAKPSIALADPMDQMRKASQVALAQREMQAMDRQSQSQDAIRNVLADPSMKDAAGNLKPEAIQQVMGYDLKSGITLDRAQLDRQAQTSELSIKGQQLIEDKVRAPSAIAYRQAKAQGLSDEQATAAAQAVYNDGLKDVKGSGLFSDTQMADMPPNFDFVRVSARSKQYLDWDRAQNQDKRQDRQLDETERSHKASERRQDASLGLQREEMGLRRQDLQLRRDEATHPAYDKPASIQYKDADGKVRQLEAQQDNNPKSKTYGQWVTADEKHEPIKGSEMRHIKSDTPLPGDESVEGTARAIAEYRQAPLSNFAMAKPQGAAIMARVRELNGEYDATTYAQRVKAARDFGTGPQGNTARALNVAVSHLDTLDELAGALKNGDTKAINQIKNSLGSQFGKVAPGNFDFAKQLVADEVIKAVLGNGAGGTEERKRLEDNFSKAKSWDQLRGVIATAEEMMGGQLGGIRQQYSRTTGRKDFDENFLSDRTSDVLSRHEPKRARGGEPAVGGSVPKGETPKFTEGKVYVDAQGNKARYENGKFVDVQ